MEHKEMNNQIIKEGLTESGEKSGNAGSNATAHPLSQAELAAYIDHTLLKPESVESQFIQLCQEAIRYNFKSVCVNSSWVPFVANMLKGTGIAVCSVIGFPLGAMDTRSKAFEAGSAVAGGATELDMVLNIGALKSGNLSFVEKDIRAVKRACKNGVLLKVILETGLLTESEKIQACEICMKAGADFVKTSTGFAGSGATIADIALMRSVVGPSMGVKASGGIRTFDQAIALIHAGANRLGCGASIEVITGAEAKGDY